jgi:hypothetical protein
LRSLRVRLYSPLVDDSFSPLPATSTLAAKPLSFDHLVAAALSEPLSPDDVRDLFVGAWRLGSVTQRQRDAVKQVCDALCSHLHELDAQTQVAVLWGAAKLGFINLRPRQGGDHFHLFQCVSASHVASRPS